MRNSVLWMSFAAAALSAGPAAAEPIRVSSGAFVLDIEGDMFSFNGDGVSLTTTQLFVYSPKLFPGRCDPSGSQLGFCGEAEGAPVDWSFHTTGGEQLFGRGNATFDGVNATGVDFVGSLQFSTVPTPLSSGGTGDFDFVAPFSFEATIRGLQNGNELFARQFTGLGSVSVNYEATLTPGIFSAADETIQYEFADAATPEPGTLWLLASGAAILAARRQRHARRI
jgi:hypothetical protein